jgi:SAM-dependent methyltransferase
MRNEQSAGTGQERLHDKMEPMAYGHVDIGAYSSGFFQQQLDESSRSAGRVIPLLLELFPVGSVLDVGCGVGAWARAFVDAGVSHVIGVDGEYVDRRQLLLSADSFVPHDLTRPLDLGRRFDLVACLEVAEHLPPDRADTLIAGLARHADIVLFSAAVPGQGGTNHVNEQWPGYWARLFGSLGYEGFDVLRPRLWHDAEIGFWFRQNLLVFATGAAAEHARALPRVDAPLDVVHPEQFTRRNQALEQIPSIRTSLGHVQLGLRRKLFRTTRHE